MLGYLRKVRQLLYLREGKFIMGGGLEGGGWVLEGGGLRTAGFSLNSKAVTEVLIVGLLENAVFRPSLGQVEESCSSPV